VKTRLAAPFQDTPEAWMAALARVVGRMTLDEDHAGVPGAIAAGIAEEFGVALAAIWLYDPADDTLPATACAGRPHI
jgi:hypothetical protein